MLLLVNGVFRPEIDAFSQLGGTALQIGQSAQDPISTCSFTIYDQGSQITVAEMQEVVVIDESAIANPAQNFAVNPTLNPYTTNWTTVTTTGITFSQNGGGGLTITYSNCAAQGNQVLYQNAASQGASLVIPGQAYMFSATVSGASPVNIGAKLSFIFQDAAGNTLQTVNSTLLSPTSSAQILSVSGTAPAGSVRVQIAINEWVTNTTTNSGSITYTNMQFEPMWFTSVGMTYPSPVCNSTQTNCYVLPDGSTIRQKRLFGGFITHFVHEYEGANRLITCDCVDYGWLLAVRFFQGNAAFTNQYDSQIINAVLTTPYPTQFTQNHVQQGLKYSSINWAWGTTLRDIFTQLASATAFIWFVDPYWDMWYVPPGFYGTGYSLSNQPDPTTISTQYVVRALGSTLVGRVYTKANPAVTTFVYSRYQHEVDFTQPASAISVVEGGGANYVKTIHAGSQAHYTYSTWTIAFDKLVNENTISNDTDAYSRGLGEALAYAFARNVYRLELDQRTPQANILPGYAIALTNTYENISARTLIVQKVQISYLGTDPNGATRFLYKLELGDFDPTLSNLQIRALRHATQPGTTLLTQSAIHVITSDTVGYSDSERHTP